jgi:formylglycine-generating enzyme required for sulfatase activity
MNRSEEKRSKTVRGKLALGVVRQSFVSRSGSKDEPFVSSLAVIDATYVASQRSLTSPAFGRKTVSKDFIVCVRCVRQLACYYVPGWKSKFLLINQRVSIMRRISIGLLASAGFLTLLITPQADAGVITFGSGTNKFEMTFVEIGSPDNADDATGAPNPAGKVEYTYQMGKYEVSRDMITKANAVGGLGITLDDMSSYGGNGVDKPATGVSWNEAARFVNWLNTSQGFQAAYNFTTSVVNGNIDVWSSGEAWQLGGENLYRHKDAHYWLPSMDEWYKAAYYNPNTGLYGDYPSLDGNEPSAVSSGTADNTAVYGQTGPADITLAGGLSPFGIMGLGGNVYEWEETSLNLNNSAGSSSRGIRGGSWDSSSFYLSSSNRSNDDPAFGWLNLGIRVASLSSPATVPEPGSLAVWSAICVGGLCFRRRRVRK